MKHLSIAAIALAIVTGLAGHAEAQKVRIGYWSSGVSLGFGSVLQTGKFMEKRGLEVEYITFPDVNAPTKAIAAGAIDFAIGASAGGSMSVVADGLPMSIILATQVAQLDFVVLEDSPIKTMEELKGKKIGMSPAGSATAAITAAILDKNYGFAAPNYQAVPGNDSRVAQFLVQKDIDVAALRGVSIALLPELKLRKLSSFSKEWAKITGKNAPPVLALGLIRNDWLKAHPEGAAKIVAAMRDAYEFGKKDKAAVAKALVASAHLKETDAKAYAALWDDIYTVDMSPDAIASLKAQFEIFKSVGAVKGELPAGGMNPTPFEQSKAIK